MRNLLKTCCDIVAKVWSNVKKILIPRALSTEIQITSVLWTVLITIEPLFSYTFVINDEKKSLELNTILAFVITILCTVLQLHRMYIHSDHVLLFESELGIMSSIITMTEYLGSFLTFMLYGLLHFTKRMDTPQFSIGMTLVLSMYLLRVLGIYRFLTKQVTTMSSTKATVIKIGLNLVFYLFGGHLFGGLWHFSAIWKKMECWHEACSNHHGCYFARHGFHVTWGDNKFLSSTCLPNDKLGIIEEAFETGIIELKELPKKWLYCFRWGLQNLSNFGQSLKVSTHSWENIFVIFLALYGMVTFIYFIGNMQMLINSATEKSKEERQKEEEMRRQEKEIKRRQQEMEQWFPFQKLSEKLQNSLKEYQRYKWQQTEGVNIENLLNNLPIDLQKSVKREICLQMLKNIEKFKRWSEASLVHICDCIKPVVYVERSCIVIEGDLIIEMYFVLQGNLWTYSSWSSTNNIPQDNNLLTYGDFWGEELVSWAQNELSLSNIPRSNKTIQARTKVEAFALMAGDLKDTFIKQNHGAQVIQSYFHQRRMRALRRNAQTSA